MRRIAMAVWVVLVVAAVARAEDTGAESQGDPRMLEEARALLAQANAHRDARRFEEAEAAYERAIALLAEGGVGKEEIAGALNEFGGAHQERGRAAEAQRAWQRALALRREVHQGDHQDVATSLNNLALALDALGRHVEALPLREEALAMDRRLFPHDHPHVATDISGLACTLGALGRRAEALPLNEEALAIYRRLFKGDHPSVATSLNNLASTLDALGRHTDALTLHEEALAMRRRLFPGDHPHVAASLNNLGALLHALARHAEALSRMEEALSMNRRMFKGDHPHVCSGLSNVASILDSLGRQTEAVALLEEALAMDRRLFRGDHPSLATTLNQLALSLGALGRHTESLPLQEDALAMRRRLFPGGHPEIATSLNNLASTLDSLGRHAAAVPLHAEALTIRQRFLPGNHPDVATSLNQLAISLGALGRHTEALPLFEDALGTYSRSLPGDHPRVAATLGNLAVTLVALGRPAEALPLQEESVAISRRLYPGGHPELAVALINVGHVLGALGRHADALLLDEEAVAMLRRHLRGEHPYTARALSNLGSTLDTLGRHADALPLEEEALAMWRRLFSGDHPDVAMGLHNFAHTLDKLRRHDEAKRLWHEAADMGTRVGWPGRHWPLVALGRRALDTTDTGAALAPLGEAIEHLETLRARAQSLGAEGSALYAAATRRADPYPPMIEALVALGRPVDGLGFLERGRARAMLDLLEEGREDPLAKALAQARATGDAEAVRRLEAVQRAVADAEATVVLRGKEAERVRAGGVRDHIRAAIDAQSAARKALEKATRDRLHALRDMLPETRPLPPAEIQALLAPGERMLVYGVGDRASFAYLVKPTGEAIEAVRLSTDLPTLSAAVTAYAEALGGTGRADLATGRRLFEMLVPGKVWTEVKSAKRLYLLPHGPLHRIPFEALVVGERYWVDEGPPIAYAPSASVLAWLKSKASDSGEGFVAVGDPRFEETSAPWPEKGVLVRELIAGGLAAELGLRPGDVLVGYADKETPDMDALRAALGGAPAGAATVPLRFVREGEEHAVQARPGRLGVYLAEEPPAVSGPALLAQGQIATVLRSGASRRGSLPALPGTRREVEAIREACASAGGKTVALLGAEATEERLFETAKGARYLHLATHGLIDETESASFSALALTRPRVPVPGDDGFLTLADLLERWRGRLDGTRLVVLSACETQKGRLLRDEGMLALPLGFCFAGARAAVASVWRVDDKSTALLMEDLYRRMLAEGAPGPCEALHEARKALRKTHPDPYYWGAFVYIGAP